MGIESVCMKNGTFYYRRCKLKKLLPESITDCDIDIGTITEQSIGIYVIWEYSIDIINSIVIELLTTLSI